MWIGPLVVAWAALAAPLDGSRSGREAADDLSLAATVGDLYLAQAAVDRGADPAVAIDKVLRRCDGPMAEILVDAGAEPVGTAARRPLQCPLEVAEGLARRSPGWQAALLGHAAGAESMELLDVLLEGPDPSDETLSDALHEAVKGRHDEAAARLLRAGARARPETIGEAARGVEAGEAGRRVRRLTAGWRRAELGEALIFVAHHDPAVVSALLARGAPTDRTRGTRGPPLVEAAAAGRVDNVKRLIAAGADPNGARSDGRTPLMVGARSPEVTDALLRAGADPNQSMISGWTPLMSAARSSAQSVRRLLEAGAAVDAAMHSSREQAVHQAARVGRADVLEVLIGAGAELGQRTESPTGAGELPLTLALAAGHADAVEVLRAAGAPGVE